MRASAFLLGLAALVFLAFPVVALLGGWHGNLVLIGVLTAAGYLALGLHAWASPPARWPWFAPVLLFAAAAYGLLLSVSLQAYLDLAGPQALFLLGAAGTAWLAMGRPSPTSWFLWATAAAWLIEGLASLPSIPASTLLALNHASDGVAAAGLVAAWVCAIRRRAAPSPAQSL